MKSLLKKAILSMLLLTISLGSYVTSGASEPFMTISNSGTIDYTSSPNLTWIPSEATLLWSTEWNDLQVTIPHNFINVGGVSTENGKLKLEGNLGTQVPARRPRIYLTDFPYVEYWMKAVFVVPEIPENWLTFFEPMAEQPVPVNVIQFVIGNDGGVNVEFTNIATGVPVYKKIRAFYIEANKPFEIIFHIKRDFNNGLVEVWNDDVLVYEYNQATMFKQDGYNYPIIADCYMGSNEPTKIVYQDSFEVWVI